MKKRIYTAPGIEVIEILGCNVICSSILIDDEEINTGGRANKHHDNSNWGSLWE